MTTAQDVARREAIAEYGVLDQPPSSDLQALVQLATTVCGVPRAVINIIDDRFQHQVAAVGFEPAVCRREDSMCARVFQNPGHVVIPDARLDDRFRDNPFVDGTVALVRFYASSPLVTPTGIPIGTLCVFGDEVGELSPAGDEGLRLLAGQVVDVLELRRLTRELAETNEQLESFAGQISHDLRNPLTALAGFIELAADSPELANAPRAARALARAESAATRMADMITDLLDYARIGGALPHHDPVELADVAAAAVEDLSAVIAATDATVTVHAGARVFGDATLLRVLLQNLVANALKFAAAAGRVPRVEIHAEPLYAGWRLTVDDNGPGVPAAERDRVFDLMERATDMEVPGLGIGLSTCRRIVEAHGGRIGIDEAPLGGARIWIVLPA